MKSQWKPTRILTLIIIIVILIAFVFVININNENKLNNNDYIYSLSTCNVDDDEKKEIVSVGEENIRMINDDGTTLWEINNEFGDFYPIIKDYNNNGYDDIVISFLNYSYVILHNGDLLNISDINDNIVEPKPRYDVFKGDGKEKVQIKKLYDMGKYVLYIEVYDASGNIIWKREQEIGHHYYPQVLDVDNDTYEEIVIFNNDKVEIIQNLNTWKIINISEKEMNFYLMKDTDLDGILDIYYSFQRDDLFFMGTMNIQGQKIWEHNYTIPGAYLQYLDFNGDDFIDIVLIGSDSFVLMDIYGSEVFNASIQLYYRNIEYIFKIQNNNNINYIVCTSNSGLDHSQCWIFMIDEYGDLIWEKYWRMYLGYCQIISFNDGLDQGLLATGFYRDWGRSGGGELHIVNIDGNDLYSREFWDDENGYPTNLSPRIFLDDIDLDGEQEIIIGSRGVEIYNLDDII